MSCGIPNISTYLLCRSVQVLFFCFNPKLTVNLKFEFIFEGDFFGRDPGYILLYSLKNPSFPETKLETDSACMCLDFHSEYPNLLAAGFSDGTVLVYNLKYRIKRNEGFIIRSSAIDKHADPVWQVNA